MEKTLSLVQTSLQRHHELLVNNMMCAGFAVLIYDHSITLGYEVDFIWSAPTNLISLLFLLNRYLVPAVILGKFYEKFAPDHSIEFCKVWVILQCYLTIISYASLHAVVALRVVAIYSGSFKIKRFLWIGGLFYVLSTTGFVTGASLSILAEASSSTGACVVSNPSYFWALWLPTVVVESILFIVTVYSAAIRFTSYKNLGAFYPLFRDSAIYFLVVTCSSLSVLLTWAEAPGTLIELARPFSLCIVTVAGSRLILNLKACVLEESRNASETKTQMGTTYTSPDFEFRTNASWNVSAPNGTEVQP